jgi:hypothetical protein
MPPSPLAIRKIAQTQVHLRLAYRRTRVKATSGGLFAAKLRSGKRGPGVIVLPGLIG